MLQEEIDAIAVRLLVLAEDGDADGAWDAAAPLVEHQARNGYAAFALLRFAGQRAFSLQHSLEIVRAVFDAHADDATLLGSMGSALEGVHDIRFLNAPAASDPIFETVAKRLRDELASTLEPGAEIHLLTGLATAARLLGRAWDHETERAYARLAELRPTHWQDRYDLGLFFKVRGRFAEGVVANEQAVALGGGDDDGVLWNLGICATGARDAQKALSIWKGIGQRLELGRFGLPDGSYGEVKARLAEHPAATRPAGVNEPGQEETVWIERLSPCHGIVRSALYGELGIDYGDVVLFDGAPIMHQTYGDAQIPVFPHLATLERPGYRIFRFVGAQPAPGAFNHLSKHLPEDAVVYSHTENAVVLCAHCWENETLDHAGHRSAEHHIVQGKLCAPPSLTPHELRAALDGALAGLPGVQLFVPELSELLGDHARADVERRRIAMVVGT